LEGVNWTLVSAWVIVKFAVTESAAWKKPCFAYAITKVWEPTLGATSEIVARDPRKSSSIYRTAVAGNLTPEIWPVLPALW
jgi:hypothetical protein